jgi:hypothetical protein
MKSEEIIYVDPREVTFLIHRTGTRKGSQS